MVRGASLTTAAPKQMLFAAGEPAREISILLEGNVALLAADDAGREIALDVVCPVQLVLPWIPVMGVRHSVSAKVIRPAQLLNIPLVDLQVELGQDGALSELLVARLSQRTRALLAQIEDLKLRTATQRLAHYLLSEAAPGQTNFDVVLPYKKHVIASQLGMTPESLSRSFAALRPLGVTMTGHRVLVGDAERLRLFCQHDFDGQASN